MKCIITTTEKIYKNLITYNYVKYLTEIRSGIVINCVKMYILFRAAGTE